MKNIFTALLISILLVGCATNKDVIITDREVRINPAALAPCADLMLMPEEGNFDTVLSITIANAEIYLDCKNKQDNSIKLLKQFSNVKKETKP